MRTRLAWVTVAVLLLVLAGCGSDGGEAAGDETTAPAEEATTASEDETGAPSDDEGTAAAEEATTAAAGEDAAGATVAVSSTELGDVLVDGEGRTLYVFLNDEQGESVCYDDCETNWPPLAGPAEAGEGVDASLLGTVDRDDGSSQTTYGDWPLYHFAADSAPGDVNGQGVGDVWFVVGADGEPIQGDSEEAALYR